MSQTPLISRVLIVPGLPAPTDESLANTNFRSISIGLVIDNNRVVWGDYQPEANGANPLTLLQEKVSPVFEGRPLIAFREMLAELDELTETAVLTRPRPQPPSGSVSRRGFLTGKMETAVKTEQVVVERPLPPPLLASLSQLLLTALADTRHVTITELIAAESNFPFRPTLVPIHLDITDQELPLDTAVLSNHIQALGYRITSHDPQAQLGPNGEKLQRFIRQLTSLLGQVTQADYRPAIHLDVNGGLGALFENNIGRILGAVYGLEQAAQPYPLRITDPLLTDDANQQIKWMGQLMDYLRLRGMKTELAANSPIQSLADVTRFAESRAAHMLVLSLTRLGNIKHSIEAVRICQQSQLACLLRDGPASFTSQFALATQPNYIMAAWEPNNPASLAQIYREMTRTITFFTQIRA
jgi:methylaspartate ammonia-lyase